ncbi:hypothetical protein D3C71_460900 [compost metagenome]
MTISPCAMLMMPMTPKVMARPMAASSRTEPRDMPYQTFWATFQSCCAFWIEAIALSRSGFRLGSMDEETEFSTPRPLAPRPEIVSIAARFSSIERSEERSDTARASSMRAFTSVSVSLASAASTSSRASALGERKIASAAERRAPRSGLISVRPPRAARIARRRLLLTLILVTAPFATWPALSPVTGSISSS